MSYINIFRGYRYGICRDIISNSIPDLYKNKNNNLINFNIILFSTILSQGFHNCQTVMQIKNLNYKNSLKYLYNNFGYSFLYKGFQNRLFLFYFMSIFS